MSSFAETCPTGAAKDVFRARSRIWIYRLGGHGQGGPNGPFCRLRQGFWPSLDLPGSVGLGAIRPGLGSETRPLPNLRLQPIKRSERGAEERKRLWQRAAGNLELPADPRHAPFPALGWNAGERPALVCDDSQAAVACLGDHEGVCSISTAAPAGELFVDRADGALNLLDGVNGNMVPNPGLDVVVLGASLDPYRPGQKDPAIDQGISDELPHARECGRWIVIVPSVQERARVEDEHGLCLCHPLPEIIAQRPEVAHLDAIEEARRGGGGHSLAV